MEIESWYEITVTYKTRVCVCSAEEADQYAEEMANVLIKNPQTEKMVFPEIEVEEVQQ